MRLELNGDTSTAALRRDYGAIGRDTSKTAGKYRALRSQATSMSVSRCAYAQLPGVIQNRLQLRIQWCRSAYQRDLNGSAHTTLSGIAGVRQHETRSSEQPVTWGTGFVRGTRSALVERRRPSLKGKRQLQRRLRL